MSDHRMLEVAASLWEAVLNAYAAARKNAGTVSAEPNEQDEAIIACFEGFGTASVRYDIVEMSEELEKLWEQRSPGFHRPFDWEFCPLFVAHAIDWDGPTGPVLRPDANLRLAAAIQK